MLFYHTFLKIGFSWPWKLKEISHKEKQTKLMPHCLNQQFSKCGFWTSSIIIIWEPVKNANSVICVLMSPPGVSEVAIGITGLIFNQG